MYKGSLYQMPIDFNLHISSFPQFWLLFWMLQLRLRLPFSRPLPAYPRAPNLRLLRRHKHRLHLPLFPPRHQMPQPQCRQHPPLPVSNLGRIRAQTNSRMQLRVKRAQPQRVPSRVPCPRSLLPPCRTLAQRSTMSTRHRTSAQYKYRVVLTFSARGASVQGCATRRFFFCREM